MANAAGCLFRMPRNHLGLGGGLERSTPGGKRTKMERELSRIFITEASFMPPVKMP